MGIVDHNRSRFPGEPPAQSLMAYYFLEPLQDIRRMKVVYFGQINEGRNCDVGFSCLDSLEVFP